ncbi:MAG TPA: YCF48-related protein [Pyrinomonadaceae bacterium]|jgi:photosystem II stability/assembly factor-like uncharacterized protein
MNLIRKISVFLFCLVCFQTANAGWTKQNSKTLAWLQDIYFINEKKGWITGSDGTFLETTDGGRNWRQSEKFTSDTIRQVYFSDEQTGWLLCERNIYNRGANLISYILQTFDGGRNWEKTEFASEGRGRIAKIIFNEKGAAMAIGEGGAIFTPDSENKGWDKTPFFIKYLLLDGVFTDKMNASIVGAGGSILFTEDGGSTWNRANVFGDKTAKLHSVFFINRKIGWTVGAYGKIFHTFSGGKTWREQDSGTTKNLNDIFFLNSVEGWAIGDEGTILHTNSAGNVWNSVDSGAKHKLEKVTFVGDKGWAVGFGGTILFYDGNAEEKPLPKPQLNRRNE